jgi:hypothetical protein
VDVEELTDTYPRLFHMAAAGAWPSIAANGLLPTTRIVSTSKLGADERAAILDEQRPRSVSIVHPSLGPVVVRDQSPLRRHILESVLVDMSVRQWLATLNDRVFFWLHPNRLATLLHSRPNRGKEHDVLTIDTAGLVAGHHRDIRLSAVNSGATLWPSAPRRGSATFLPIEDYPFAERRKGRTIDNVIAELAVIGGVPDIAAHTVAVHRRRGTEIVTSLYP